MNNIKGIQSFQNAVKADCKKGENCFSETGCTKRNQHHKCFHQYCDKYAWVIDRAKHYSEKTGKTFEDIMEIWEEDRSYWYMNYYQDANQPLIEGDNVTNYDDWIQTLKNKFGEDTKQWAFKCPACGNIQKAQDFIDNNLPDQAHKVYTSCIGRFLKGKGCDWSINGLINIAESRILKDGKVYNVFAIAE